MKWTWRFVLPVILGIAAAGVNYFVLSMRLAPRGYIKANDVLKRGTDFFSEANLSEEKLLVDVPAAVPWTDRKVLYELPVSRDLQKGDLIFRSDIVVPDQGLQLDSDEVALNISLEGVKFEANLLQIGREVGFAIADAPVRTGAPAASSGESKFEAVGKFRIVSVGARISSDSSNDAEKNRSAVATLSVATTKTNNSFDKDASRLLQANRDKTIVALILYPNKTNTKDSAK